MSRAIQVENVSKQYRLGQIGTGALSHDLNRWWHKVRGKEDPYLRIGETNDRTQKGSSDYVWSLRDINFEIEQGDSVGIIGRNGAGKSTLLKILSRVTAPTTGGIKVKGRIASLLEVGTGFHPELSGRDNIYLNGAILGMRKHEIRRKFDEIVEFAGVERYIDTPVKRYSSGMYVRLAFAVAAHLESEILIVDEVLAVGDAEFQKKCLGKMNDVSKGEGRTILFVSHNMAAIRSLCNNSVYLKNGLLHASGQTSDIIGEYLNEGNRNKNIKYYKDILKYVKIQQEKDQIVIEAEYNCQFVVAKPHFGYIIYNSLGTPIFGSNPTLDIVNSGYEQNTKRGKIRVTISQPKLIDGKYIASIWFGNGDYDFLEDTESLEFEVSGMTKKKYHPASDSGNITPETKWSFEVYE